MANENKIPVRGHFQFNFSEDVYKKYQKVRNKTQLITELLEQYFDDNIINVKIDDSIKQKYEDDPYKDIRIRLLLLEFYTKGNINTLLSNSEPISLSTNVTRDTSSDNIINNEISTDTLELSNSSGNNEEVIEIRMDEEVNIINKDEEHKVQTLDNKSDNDTIDTFNASITEGQKHYTNEKDEEENLNDEENSKDTFDIPTEKVGSIKSMFKGNIPRNKRNVL